ncbi:MAG: hypothetical protein ABIT38_22280 [Gemmatimonadaceae bacterium]
MLQAKIAKAQNLFVNPNKLAILKFMEKYPVHPPNGIVAPGHHTAKAPMTLGGVAPSTVGTGSTHVRFSKQKLTNIGDRVAFINCIEETAAGEKGSLSFDVKFGEELTTALSRVGRAPIWWLPWNGQGSLVKMKIEGLATSPTLNLGPGIANQANPNLFFTAAINGCSIFAYGDLDGPTIYHAGLTGDVMLNLGESATRLGVSTSEEAWGALLNKVTFSGSDINPGGGARKQDTKANFSEVNRGAYVAERKGKGFYEARDFVSGTTGKTTKRARNFQAWLERHPTGAQLRAYSLSPWGCVFGIRTGNAWEMWLQRNATVIHSVAKRPHKLGGITWGDLVSTGGMAQVQIVTLGLQKVFPTAEPVHYREFNQINFI